MADLDNKIKQLIEAAFEVKNRAYCPYSNFKVGAAVLCHDGSMFTGCNVENASYGLTICGERAAIIKAVSEGYTKFKAMAIACDLNHFQGPCGACRQTLVEFGFDWDLYMTKPDKTWKKITVGELLPLGFGPSTLNEERL